MITKRYLKRIVTGLFPAMLILILLVSVTACTKAGTTSSSTTAVTSSGNTLSIITPSSGTGITTSVTTPSPNIAASGKGTLRLADTGPITLDPAVVSDATSGSYILQIFSGLVRTDNSLNIVPDIAQSWDKSTDGKTYTFHLRKDVKFHDGKGVTASDFKYSWERALNPATQSQTAGTYLNDIVGSVQMLSGQAASLSGIKVLDDYTLQVTIDGPKAYYLEKMAFPTAFVVEKANVQSGSNWWQKPVGSGPFKLKQWQTDQLLVLSRNDSFYGDRARVAEVDFQLFSGDPVAAYESGTIDVTYVPSVYMGLVTDPSNPVSRELNTFPELSFSYLGFNSAAPPFDDPKVRQAFSYAVDKQKIVTLALNGVVTAASGILPPGMPGFNANLQGLNFDVTRAKQLIIASKYGDVSKFPPVVLTTSGWGGEISGVLGGLISDWKNNLGVTVTVRQIEPQAFLYSLSQEVNQLFDNGWIADYPDPQDFLDVLFSTGSSYNTGGYSNPQLDTLLKKAATEPDQSTRFKEYQDAEQMIVSDAAVLPLFFAKNYVLVKPNIKNYFLNALGFPMLNQVSIQ